MLTELSNHDFTVVVPRQALLASARATRSSNAVRARKVHVPVGVMAPLAKLLHPLPGFPVTPDQLLMLGEDSVCDPRPFFEAIQLEPVPLATGLERMLGT